MPGVYRLPPRIIRRRPYLPSTGATSAPAVTGTAVSTIAPMTGTASGRVAIAGYSAIALQASRSSSGVVGAQAARSATLANASRSAAARVAAGGSRASTIAQLIHPAAGTVRLAGQGQPARLAMTASAAARMGVSGASSIILAGLILQRYAVVGALPDQITCSAVQLLEPFRATGAARVGAPGSAARQIGVRTSGAGGAAVGAGLELAMPALLMVAMGLVGRLSSDIYLRMVVSEDTTLAVTITEDVILSIRVSED